MMKISDLQKLLAKTKRKHGDLKLAYALFSDFELMEESDITTRVLWFKPGNPSVMGDHFSITAPPQEGMERQLMLCFPGN